MKVKAPFRVVVFHYKGERSKAFLQAWQIVKKYTRDFGSYRTWGYTNICRLWRDGMGPC